MFLFPPPQFYYFPSSMFLFPPPKFYYSPSPFLNSLPFHNINLSPPPPRTFVNLFVNTSTFYRPYINPTSTANRRHIDPTSTLHRSHIDPTSPLHRPHIGPRLTFFEHSLVNSEYIQPPPYFSPSIFLFPPLQFYYFSSSMFLFPPLHFY